MFMVEVPEPEPIDAGARAPRPQQSPQAQCSSAPGVVARIIGFSMVGTDVHVTIGAGTSAGVVPSWIVVLPKVTCPITRVDANVTRALCGATPDQIQASPQALLCPP